MNPEINAMAVAREACEALHKHYPGHLWMAEPSADFSTLMFTEMNLSSKWGFRLKLAGPGCTTMVDAAQKAVRFGGELLERYHVSRSRGLEQAKQILRDRQGVLEAAHDR